ncbi:MAG: ABC transporter ATP-binding protein [Phycisphaerae bacterium]|nr:ABC transporter ATP-binding protein [Phycisphaerae bacterium]
MTAPPASLVLTDVTKEYPTPTEPLCVLRGVSLSLAPGDRVAILGPSGSGKSTLLNIIGTLDRPTAGQVRLGEVDPFALSAADLAQFRSRRVGFVFQDHHLLPQCTALENVLLAKLAAGAVDRADVARAEELLARVGLSGRREHVPAELSGGERQRVAIARALMNRPAMLLCDEPTGNLDAPAARAVGELFVELAGETGAILIVVTHSESLAAQVGRSLRLVEGKLA